jgi:hypothetical protein
MHIFAQSTLSEYIWKVRSVLVSIYMFHSQNCSTDCEEIGVLGIYTVSYRVFSCW